VRSPLSKGRLALGVDVPYDSSEGSDPLVVYSHQFDQRPSHKVAIERCAYGSRCRCNASARARATSAAVSGSAITRREPAQMCPRGRGDRIDARQASCPIRGTPQQLHGSPARVRDRLVVLGNVARTPRRCGFQARPLEVPSHGQHLHPTFGSDKNALAARFKEAQT
jgi:hypothetical protein